MFFAARNIFSQNGWTTYTAAIPSGTTANQENVIFIDNVGNKWVGFNGGVPSAVAIAKYDNSSSTWTYWNKASMGITTTTISNSVKAIAQDNSGNIWIGTTSGLIKYDGLNFTVYTTVNGLPNNYIYSLEYSNNMLYIGTGNGLSRYDGITFTNYNLGNSLLPLPFVNDIKAENSNTLWMTSYNKLVKFYINSAFTSTSYTLSTTTNTGVILNKIYIDPAGIKWFVNQSGIIKYDNISFTYFNSMYPNYVGYSFDGLDIGKGPNNGVLVTAWSGKRCLIEFLSGGNYNTFNSPPTFTIGTSFENDVSGKLWLTGSVSTSTATGTLEKIHSFDATLYNPVKAFGWGSGINSDNYKYLDINRVKAGIMNRGDMWWDIGRGGNAAYEVPKTGLPAAYGVNAEFAGALWIGGLDASNQLHTSAQTYRQTGNDFWPGPLDTINAVADTITAVNYDKIWKVDFNDINTFVTQFNLGNVPMSFTPTPDIVNWPAHGTGNKSRCLAPFYDRNGDGLYNWQDGDYPKIKGDQTLYFIFNDNLGPHSETGGLPFGIEVHAMAYAYNCPKVLNGRNELAYTTFYDYKIYNRSNNNYHDVHLGLWNDVDLGNYGDDFIGSSPQDNLGFCYNSDSNDENNGAASGYNLFPPAIGTAILKGPPATIGDGKDNDNDSIIDELNEECMLSYFDYFNNGGITGSGSPATKYHYYNILQGKWRDSLNLTCGGNGYGGTTITRYAYPWANYLGNPCGTWTEFSVPNLAGDRRYIASAGPFNLIAKQMVEFEFAQIWSVDSSATSNINIASVDKLIDDTRKIRNFYKTGAPNCLFSVGVNELELKNGFIIYPNPANSNLFIRSDSDLGKCNITIYDVLGKIVLESTYDNLSSTLININQLNSGIYFLNIKTEKGQAVKKFVKE